MPVGFTGTQNGMQPRQRQQVVHILHTLDEDEFHHGLCYGSDEEAHWIAKGERYRIIGHPPLNKRKMMATPHDQCDVLKGSKALLGSQPRHSG